MAKADQAKQMNKLGMEVVKVELRDTYVFSGQLHCDMAEVYREKGARIVPKPVTRC